MNLTPEQFRVKSLITRSLLNNKSCCLTGAAGTGKTTVLKFLINELQQFKNISAVAPTHQACSVLRSVTNQPVATIASVLKKIKEIDYLTGEITFNPRKFQSNKRGLIIIDESSMLSSNDVLTFANNYPKSTFLFVGDKYQLPPVNDEDFSIFDYFPTHELMTNMRCGKGNAMFDLIESIRKSEMSIPTIEFGGNVHNVKIDNIDGSIPIIVYFNNTRKKWNNWILNRISGGVINNNIKFIANENIGYDRQTSQYIIKNGTIFNPTFVYQKEKKIDGLNIEYWELGYQEKTLSYLDEFNKSLFENFLKPFEVRGDWVNYYKYKSLFPDIDLAYSVTSHKTQGSTFHSSIVDLDDFLKIQKFKIKKSALYVATSRNKESLFII